VVDIRFFLFGGSRFNRDVSGWDLRNVRSAYAMFSGAFLFNSDLSQWNLERCTDLGWVFHDCRSLDTDVSGWRVGSARNMQNMFAGYVSLLFVNSEVDYSPLSHSANTVRSFVFHRATSLNSSMASWDISNVADLSEFLDGAVSFSQDLCAWGSTIQPPVNVDRMFQDTACPSELSPDLTSNPYGPFCHVCNAASNSTTLPAFAPMTSPSDESKNTLEADAPLSNGL